MIIHKLIFQPMAQNPEDLKREDTKCGVWNKGEQATTTESDVTCEYCKNRDAI